MKESLEGYRILELGDRMAGALCGLLLSDYGAEVIRIEPPCRESFGQGGISIEERSRRATLHRGKKSVSMDLCTTSGKEEFAKLVRTAAVVIESCGPGELEQEGITYEFLTSIQPAIVYTSISGYGQEGPYAGHPWSDSTVQAESGMVSVTGLEEGEAVKCGGAIAQCTGAMNGCIGTLMALLDVERSGKGRRIDVSMMDSIVWGMENQFSISLRTGIAPKPRGNNYALSAPVGNFVCGDGKEIMISIATDRQWETFAEVLGHEEWLNNPAYMTIASRLENYKALNKDVGGAFREHTCEEAMQLLQSRKSIYGRVNNFADVENHPQVAVRQSVTRACYSNGESFRVPASPIHMNERRQQEEYHVSRPGEDTVY